jgi:hypothetical protein
MLAGNLKHNENKKIFGRSGLLKYSGDHDDGEMSVVIKGWMW